MSLNRLVASWGASADGENFSLSGSYVMLELGGVVGLEKGR